MEYFYGMKARGFSPLCQPKKGLKYRKEDESNKYYDIIIYDRLLSKEEVDDYDLEFLKKREVN